MKGMVEIIEKTSQQSLCQDIKIKSEINVKFDYNQSVENILRKQSKISEDAFFVADLGIIIEQHTQWKNFLPRVEPFYAIKCNPDPVIAATLHYLGAGFDCASKAEIELAISVGANPANIIYANPCKGISHIESAVSNGVTMMTFDNADELIKIKKIAPHAELILRILTDDSKSICQLGKKFGASMDSVSDLLKLARELDLSVRGISFHVGSGCMDASAFVDAIKLARQAFDISADLGYKLNVLDIGGGFPGSISSSKGPTFKDIANSIRPVIDELFDASIRVIAEPGRYYVSSALTLAVSIVARRRLKTSDNSFMYYINDGVYGSFNCTVFDHAEVSPKTLVRNGEFLYKTNNKEYVKTFKSSLWGPTCDSIDCIGNDYDIAEHDIGDWFYFENMGAYTICAASNFNGFKKPSILYTSGSLDYFQ